MRDLKALAKADLHAHFQGSVRLATLRKLVEATGGTLPPSLVGDRYEWRDFFDFLAQYGMVAGAVSAGDAYHRVAMEICEDYAAQGVPYAEVTLSLTGRALNTDDWDGPLIAALDGFEAGKETFGKQCRVIVDHPPTSNVELGNVASYQAHPLLRLIDAGVVVTLNSDDPPMFHSNLLEEHEVASGVFGLNDEAIADLARAGVRSSFADDTLKQEMAAGIDAWLGKEQS